MNITIEKAEQCVAAYRARYNQASARADVRGIEVFGERLTMWLQILAEVTPEEIDRRSTFDQCRANRYGTVAA